MFGSWLTISTLLNDVMIDYMMMMHVLFLLGFIIGTPNKMYRFLASTVEEKEEWYSNLHRHILAQKQLFSKVCPTVLSVCPSIYLSIYLSIHLSIHPSILHPSIHLSIYLSILFVCLDLTVLLFIFSC